MLITVPQEVKPGETRVALTPHGASQLVAAGHTVLVQSGAGSLSAFADGDYAAAGALLGGVGEAWSGDLVLKVKEPVPEEFERLTGNALFTFLHLAANPRLATALCEAGTFALSYDTVQLADGSLPLLAPMSRIAGRLAVLEGAHHLLAQQGGRGVLISGLPDSGLSGTSGKGVPGADVVVLGAGIAGSDAVAQAVAMGATVTVLDISQERLDAMGSRYRGSVGTVVSTPESVARAVAHADLVIGAVLVPGRKAPVIVTHAMVESMRPGSVLVDIAIDQGGCFEDSRPTTHADPTFAVAKSIMYCVANMPGAVGHTATRALTEATMPYVVELASGVEAAVASDAALATGVNVREGKVVHPAVLTAIEAPSP